ncbi:MAG: Transposase and inactivated derivatives [uncultured Pyrinomonadaceae bacterium]|uniref:Transposase and inactivated derivatives n=1 Tax=uncultured Pyrinomonadaceae bacterium TaxID=2283094 RepID=A0A6J4PUY4_9BACT|nr:MAG: Transposase and inactivated derivatives [uncultured Pyrinomonadaceae bacterium]
MSKFIHKSHNVSVLMYHIVCPAKYRRMVFSETLDAKLKEVCTEIQKRYEIEFLEVGSDGDHVHFLVQSVPLMSPKKIVQIIKSLTAREIFKSCPEVKKQLWGGAFWSDGYFISTVGAHGTEEMIKNYIQQQGKLEEGGQLRLF